jgi:hypothetical protein
MQDVFTIDVDAILRENKRDLDMELKPGDLIYVDYGIFANDNASASAPQNATSSPANTPPTDKNAYAIVAGEIRMRPELRIRFDPNHPITVSYAIIMAGWTGFSKHTVFLYRDEKDKDGKPLKDVFEIDVDAILNGSKPDQDMKLKQGDLVYVYSILPPFGKASGSVPPPAPSSPANTPLTLNISTGGTATISGLTVDASNIVKVGDGTINIEPGTAASAAYLTINVSTGATLTISGNLGHVDNLFKTGKGNLSNDGMSGVTGNVYVSEGFLTDGGNIGSKHFNSAPTNTALPVTEGTIEYGGTSYATNSVAQDGNQGANPVTQGARNNLVDPANLYRYPAQLDKNSKPGFGVRYIDPDASVTLVDALKTLTVEGNLVWAEGYDAPAPPNATPPQQF